MFQKHLDELPLEYLIAIFWALELKVLAKGVTKKGIYLAPGTKVDDKSLRTILFVEEGYFQKQIYTQIEDQYCWPDAKEDCCDKLL